MSAKQRPHFACVQCSGTHPDYVSQCPSCGAYLTLVPIAQAIARGVPLSWAATGTRRVTRIATGFEPADRVLDGGIVAGSLVVLAGGEGSGKSTLAIQCAGFVAKRREVIVASWEQSRDDLGEIAARLGVDQRPYLLPATPATLRDFVQMIAARRPALAIADSVPEIATASGMSEPDVVLELHHAAHDLRVAVVGILHLNKAGEIAGPRRTAFRADATVHMDGSPADGPMRVLRSSKNRGGVSALRIPIELTASGFVASDPGRAVLDRRSGAAGSAIGIVLGTDGRANAIEVQALVSPPAKPPANGNSGRRIQAIGLSKERVAVLVDVIARAGVPLGDVIVSVADGATTSDLGADAAICAAMVSAVSGKALGETAWIGEVGLGAELRSARGAAAREAEAQRLGLRVGGAVGRSILTSLSQGHLHAV